jgi:hypothetical protein
VRRRRRRKVRVDPEEEYEQREEGSRRRRLRLAVADSGCDDELWLHIFAARIHERRKRGSVAHLKAMRGQLALRMQASQRGFMRGGVWLAGPTARPCTRAWARCTVKGECGSTKDTYGSGAWCVHMLAIRVRGTWTAWANRLRAVRGDDGAHFYFMCTLSKLQNSQKRQLSWKSPKVEVVDEL